MLKCKCTRQRSATVRIQVAAAPLASRPAVRVRTYLGFRQQQAKRRHAERPQRRCITSSLLSTSMSVAAEYPARCCHGMLVEMGLAGIWEAMKSERNKQCGKADDEILEGDARAAK